jgi:hypothetical protein
LYRRWFARASWKISNFSPSSPAHDHGAEAVLLFSGDVERSASLLGDAHHLADRGRLVQTLHALGPLEQELDAHRRMLELERVKDR